MESSFFLFFLYEMYILVGKQQTYANFTRFFLGVTSPESYSVTFRNLEVVGKLYNKE